MQSELCCCGYCQASNKITHGLDVPDAQWLEELGEMIVAAVEGLGREQPFPAGCPGRLP